MSHLLEVQALRRPFRYQQPKLNIIPHRLRRPKASGLRDIVRTLGQQIGFARNGPTVCCIEWGYNVIGGRERAKHIDIRKYYAYEAIQLGHVRLVRVSTADQLADVLTKGLPSLQLRPVSDSNSDYDRSLMSMTGWGAR